MNKISQSILLLATLFSFAQNNNMEYVVSERKAAEKHLQIQVNPNTLNYDITYHELRFTVNPTVHNINGVVKTTFTALSNMNAVVFDLSTSLTVATVKQGTTNLTFSHTNNELTINLPSTLTQGNSTTVEITYSGAPSTAEGAYTTSTHSGSPIIYTLSEPFGAKDWWPCKQDLNDKVNSIDVYITAPSSYTSVSNGIQQSRVINGANATTHFRHQYPIPAYLIVLNVSNYQIYNQQAGLGTIQSPFFPIINYIYPESNTTTTQNALAVTPLILNYFESILEPYPFRNEKYGHVQFGFGGGMEHTTVSSMGGWDRDLISHEMAHQWFGDKITCGTWKDIWLNEGLTEYMSGMVVGNFDGTPAFVNWRGNKVASITTQSTGSLYLTDSEALNVGRIFSSRITYNKGSMVTHMLRWKLGNTVFFNALRSYLADPALAYGYAVTANLKSHLEAAYSGDLTEFFNDWVFNPGYPTYSITAQNYGAGQAKITVNQTRTTNAPSYFEMPIEVRLISSGGATHDVVLNNTTNAQEFIVAVPFTVADVEFDPNNHLISKDNTTVLVNESFELDKAFALYPNPATDEIKIQYPTNITIEKVELLNLLGQNIGEVNTDLIAISHLNSGNYFLRISTNKGVVHKKFIKK